MVVSEKAKDIQSKRPTTWRQNPDAKLKVPTDALLMRWAARVIEYRACGLSWDECSELIHSKEMTPYFARADTVIRIAEWRLENVHEGKMTMPPEQWRSPEEVRRASLDADWKAFQSVHQDKLDHWKACRNGWMQGPGKETSVKAFDSAKAEFEEGYANEHGPIPRFPRLDEMGAVQKRLIEQSFGRALAPTATTC